MMELIMEEPMRTLAAATVTLVAAACGPQQAPPNPAAEPAVKSLLAGKASALTDDVFLLDRGERVDGKDAVAAKLAGHALTLRSNVDSHHDVLRALVDDGGTKRMLFAQLSGAALNLVALVDVPNAGAPKPDATVAAYTTAWNTSDAAKRSALLSSAWADGGRYVDPTADVTGRASLDAHIGDFLQNTPGAELIGTSAVTSTSNDVHFRWVTKALGGAVSIDGMDFGLLDDQGKLILIAGFFGDLGAS